MRTSITASVTLIALLSLTAPPARAEAPGADAVGNKLVELGLIGRWARDCGLPLQSGNPHVFFERTEAGPRYRYVFSAASQTVRAIDGVEVLANGEVMMRVTNISGDEPGFRMEIRMAKEPKRYRMLYTKGSDGKIYVENGVIVATGRPNYWQNYCGAN